MADDTTRESQDKLSQLRSEHRELDAKLSALEACIPADQLQINRIKKRKLSIKDMIARIEDGSLPDIIA
ncbi:MAG: YdcH family protein [Alphaproteobacteria bacterium]